jgi:hypothetical protein
MGTNLSRKEQREKWSLLNKDAFVEDLLSAKPKDYQERNFFYRQVSILLSYPLQIISILAGSYLLYDIAHFVWQLSLETSSGVVVYSFCVLIFLGIEATRRWLVNTTGYNYFATLKIADNKVKKGEWLKSNLYCLIFISLLLVSTGTLGVYQYIKHNSPEKPIISVESVTSPLEQKIVDEKTSISRIDKDLQGLIGAKKMELNDKKSYAEWNGKEYLLSDVKQRHQNYDKQINDMNAQRAKHQSLIDKYEEKLTHQETKTENKNQEITILNQENKEIYAGVTAAIWLVFEFLLVFMLAYNSIYLYNSKKEKLLEQLYAKLNTPKTQGKSNPSDFVPSQQGNTKKVNGINPYMSDNLTEFSEKEFHAPQTPIGFKKWYENNAQKAKKNVMPSATPEVIIKEVPIIQEIMVEKRVEVPIIKEVVVEKKAKANHKTNSTPSHRKDGFEITCEHCGKKEVKQRKARFCSDTCRTKAWKEKKEVSV